MNPFVDKAVPSSARVLVILGVILGAAWSAMLVLFIGGEILSDPGGAEGAGYVAAWLVLPVALALLALLRPRPAYPVLVAVIGLVLLASVVMIPFAQAVWEFEDTHGPINLMVLIASLIPLIALGRSMPWEAGWLLIVTITGSMILQSVSLILVGQWSVILVFVVLMPVYVAAAVLFVIGGWRACEGSPDG